MNDLKLQQRVWGGLLVLYVIVSLAILAWRSFAGDVKYFISADESWIRTINGRPFSNAPTGSVTTQLVPIVKHPASNYWAAVIPTNQISKLPRYLTPEELVIITNAWVDTLPADWTNEVEEAP